MNTKGVEDGMSDEQAVREYFEDRGLVISRPTENYSTWDLFRWGTRKGSGASELLMWADARSKLPQPVEERTAKFRCPCCRSMTLAERSVYEICPVCFWEDESVLDEQHPDEISGPNHLSLNEGRANYAAFGACDLNMVPNVREALPEERETAPTPIPEERTATMQSSGNYIADREQAPEWVCFANGRTVAIAYPEGRRPHLVVDWEKEGEKWLRTAAAAESDAGCINIGNPSCVLVEALITAPIPEERTAERRFKHFCREWDGLEIDETYPEFKVCLCFKTAQRDEKENPMGDTYDYNNPETDRILRRERGLPPAPIDGTYYCPICLVNTIHPHTSEEIVAYQAAQKKARLGRPRCEHKWVSDPDSATHCDLCGVFQHRPADLPERTAEMEQLIGRLRTKINDFLQRGGSLESRIYLRNAFQDEASPENILKLLDHIEGKASR